ncbi:hypothetical protein D1007_49778 [Hordeum vulgare]|nr:hypothetical protein D1007_49778 [Hordeum vulgare]
MKTPLYAGMKEALSAYASGLLHFLLTGMLPSMKKNNSLCLNEASSPLQCSLLLVHFPNGSDHENFEINTDSETTKTACKDILQRNTKNRCHKINKKYFDTVAPNKVSTKSPVPNLTDGEWQALVDMWSTPRRKETCVSNKMNREKVVYQQRTDSRHCTSHIFATKEEHEGEELSAIELFKATHNSKKHLEMEERKDAPVPEGEEPKSDAQIFEVVLKTEVKQSTFLRNVGLQSSKYNSDKATLIVAIHVCDLEQKLEMSELQAEVMQEQMTSIKMKEEEYEAAHDKELELLRKKSQEHEEKLAHLMALFGAKAS